MLEINPEIFKKNLLLTQLYCDIQENNMVADEAIIDVASVFRSFIPQIDGKDVIEFGVEGYITGSTATNELVKTARWTINTILEDKYINNFYREQMAYKEKCLAGYPLDKKYDGDIVVTQFDCTVVDGASEVESYYLFDLYDLPPIDTWFYLINAGSTRLLFAWIPDKYCDYADNAIAVNCVDCIQWFKKMYEPEYKRYFKWNLSHLPLNKAQ